MQLFLYWNKVEINLTQKRNNKTMCFQPASVMVSIDFVIYLDYNWVNWNITCKYIFQRSAPNVSTNVWFIILHFLKLIYIYINLFL